MSVIFDVGQNFKELGDLSKLTKKQLDRKFNALNKKYVQLDKERDKLFEENKLTETKEEWIILNLNKIQEQMSKVSIEIEKRFG